MPEPPRQQQHAPPRFPRQQQSQQQQQRPQHRFSAELERNQRTYQAAARPASGKNKREAIMRRLRNRRGQ